MLKSVGNAALRELFRPLRSGTTLVFTVGNPLRSDDGVGPFIAKNVGNPREHIRIIDAEDKPESSVDRAVEIRPSRSVIIDAADFGGRPGEVCIIPQEAIPDTTLSTHTFPLKIIARVLAEDTGAEVFFLGIQPGSMAYGEGLSPETRAVAEEIIRLLNTESLLPEICSTISTS